MYVKYEPNEKASKHGASDCVIRAFTKVLDKTWLEVFDGLVAIARKKQNIINAKPVYVQYLKDNGFTHCSIPRVPGKPKPTVAEFAKEHPEGTYFVIVANHVVAVVDGNWYDRFDSGYYHKVYTYWKKM